MSGKISVSTFSLGVLIFLLGCSSVGESSGLINRVCRGFKSYYPNYLSLLQIQRNLKRKVCINIVLITKQEKEYLVKHGVPYAEGGVSHSESCHKRKKFYLCENARNMRLLENYRKRLYHR